MDTHIRITIHINMHMIIHIHMRIHIIRNISTVTFTSINITINIAYTLA